MVVVILQHESILNQHAVPLKPTQYYKPFISQKIGVGRVHSLLFLENPHPLDQVFPPLPIGTEKSFSIIKKSHKERNDHWFFTQL